MEAGMQALVVSKETIPGAEAIQEYRRALRDVVRGHAVTAAQRACQPGGRMLWTTQ